MNLTRKICFISASYPPLKDGVGDYLYQLIRHLSHHPNNRLFLVTSTEVHSTYSEPVTVFPLIRQWSLRNLFLLLRQIRNVDPTVVHIQYPCIGYQRFLMINCFPLIFRLCFFRSKILITIHEFGSYSIAGKLRTYLMALFSNRILVVEKSAISEITGFCFFFRKCIEKKIIYIPIGANLKNNVSLTTTKNSGDDAVFHIGYFGFVRHDKGLDILLEAFAYLIHQKHYPHIHLTLFCDLNPSDQYQNTILLLCNKLQIQDKITVTGYLPETELLSHLHQMSLCVFPFRNGFTNKRGSVLTTMAAGIPVVTTSSTDLPENIIHGENIYLVRWPDAKEIAGAIADLYHQPALRNKIAHEGHEWVKTHRNWDKIASEHNKLYSDLLNPVNNP